MIGRLASNEIFCISPSSLFSLAKVIRPGLNTSNKENVDAKIAANAAKPFGEDLVMFECRHLPTAGFLSHAGR